MSGVCVSRRQAGSVAGRGDGCRRDLDLDGRRDPRVPGTCQLPASAGRWALDAAATAGTRDSPRLQYSTAGSRNPDPDPGPEPCLPHRRWLQPAAAKLRSSSSSTTPPARRSQSRKQEATDAPAPSTDAAPPLGSCGEAAFCKRWTPHAARRAPGAVTSCVVLGPTELQRRQRLPAAWHAGPGVHCPWFVVRCLSSLGRTRRLRRCPAPHPSPKAAKTAQLQHTAWTSCVRHLTGLRPRPRPRRPTGTASRSARISRRLPSRVSDGKHPPVGLVGLVGLVSAARSSASRERRASSPIHGCGEARSRAASSPSRPLSRSPSAAALNPSSRPKDVPAKDVPASPMEAAVSTTAPHSAERH